MVYASALWLHVHALLLLLCYTGAAAWAPRMHTGCGLGPPDAHVASKPVARATELLELQQAIGIQANDLSVSSYIRGSEHSYSIIIDTDTRYVFREGLATYARLGARLESIMLIFFGYSSILS